MMGEGRGGAAEGGQALCQGPAARRWTWLVKNFWLWGGEESSAAVVLAFRSKLFIFIFRNFSVKPPAQFMEKSICSCKSSGNNHRAAVLRFALSSDCCPFDAPTDHCLDAWACFCWYGVTVTTRMQGCGESGEVALCRDDPQNPPPPTRLNFSFSLSNMLYVVQT